MAAAGPRGTATVRQMRDRILSTTEGSNTGAFGGLDWFLFIAASCIFGSSFLLIAEGLDSFSASVVTFLRIGFGFATLAVFPAARQRTDREDWPRVALIGVVWFAAPLTFFPLAQERIASSVAGMVNGAAPLFTALIATLLLRRLPGSRQRWGLLLGFGGILMIGLPSFRDDSNSTIGVLLVVAAVGCYGVAFNVAVPLQQKYGALPTMWRAQAVAVVLTAPLLVTGWGDTAWDTTAFAACAALGIGGTGLAYICVGTLTGRVGATRSSIVTYLATPFSIALGVTVRDESLAAIAALGAVVTLTGAWLTSRADDGVNQPRP